MGTTTTALSTVGRARIGFVLAIEGHVDLLCDTLDTAAVVSAWAGTGWTSALPGLKVRGAVRQSIQPWADTIDVPTLTFEIQPDPTDAFGIAVWKSRPEFRTRLTQPFEPASDGSGTIEVEETVPAPDTPPVNQLFIGGRRYDVEAISATQYEVFPSGAGTHNPFSAVAGNYYGDAVQVPAQQNWDAAAAPTIQSTPAWIGRRVALYLHRIRGTTWDTRAEAQLEFAGTIVSLKEDPRTGSTIIGCQDLRASIRDAVLFKGQWVGHVKSGIRLQTGDTLVASEFSSAGGVSTSDSFTVVASGASGDAQVNEGYYELGEFVAILNRWLAADTLLEFRWTVAIRDESGGRRLVFRAVDPAGTDTFGIAMASTSRHILEFLGFGGTGQIDATDDTLRFRVQSSEAQIGTARLVSGGPPYLTKPFQTYRHHGDGLTLELESSDGTWVSHANFIPPPFDAQVEGDDRSFITLGGRLFFARFVSATKLDDVSVSQNFAGYAAGDGPDTILGRTVEDDDERLDVMQVVVLCGSLTTIVTSLLASTDGRGINHGDFDIWPKGMGCPGIPWSLLGDPWLESVRALDQANQTESLMVVFDRPRKFLDLLLPELLLRFAWLVFKDGGYRLVSPPTPNPLHVDWVLDETNKAAPVDQPSLLDATTEVTKEHLRNVIKVEYNKTPDGKFRDHLTVRDETSIATYGQTQPITLQAVNSYTDAAGSGAAVESLASSLVARVLPAFGRPMKTVRRTIAPTLYGMAPGDTVRLTDAILRDPTSGRPPLEDRACICTAVTHTYGHEGQHPFGEVELLFTDEDRTFPMAPAVEVDTGFSGTVDGITFTSGYANTAAGGPALKVKAHAYSRASDPHDVSLLADDDLVRIYEIDPLDPASITAWDRQLVAAAAVDATDDYVLLTAELVAPAYSTTKQYRIVPQRYSQVGDDQRLHAFLADTDGLIESLAEPNTFGADFAWGFTRTTPGAFPYRLPADEVDDDGRPLHGGLLFDHNVNLNTLFSYVGGPHMPVLHQDLHTSTVVGWRLIGLFPFFVGLTPHQGGLRRISIAPILAISSSLQTASLRVTSSKFAPRGGLGQPTFHGPRRSATFTRTGSALEAVATAQSLTVVPGDIPGCTWISIEIHATGGTASFRGFNRFFLGPVEV